MQTIYFVAMVVGVGWLMVWSVMPKPRTNPYWWPFEMKENVEADSLSPQSEVVAAPSLVSSWRERAAARGTDDLQRLLERSQEGQNL